MTHNTKPAPPLDLDMIELSIKTRRKVGVEALLLADARASRIEINRLTAKAEADAFEIGRLNDQVNKLREYVQHIDGSCKCKSPEPCIRITEELEAAIGRGEDGSWMGGKA